MEVILVTVRGEPSNKLRSMDERPISVRFDVQYGTLLSSTGGPRGAQANGGGGGSACRATVTRCTTQKSALRASGGSLRPHECCTWSIVLPEWGPVPGIHEGKRDNLRDMSTLRTPSSRGMGCCPQRLSSLEIQRSDCVQYCNRRLGYSALGVAILSCCPRQGCTPVRNAR